MARCFANQPHCLLRCQRSGRLGNHSGGDEKINTREHMDNLSAKRIHITSRLRINRCLCRRKSLQCGASRRLIFVRRLCEILRMVVAHLSHQSREPDHGRRPLRSTDGDTPALFVSGHPRPRPPTNRPRGGHRASGWLWRAVDDASEVLRHPCSTPSERTGSEALPSETLEGRTPLIGTRGFS